MITALSGVSPGTQLMLTAQTFVATVGIDAHTPYSDCGYANLATVASKLRDIGDCNPRDYPASSRFAERQLARQLKPPCPGRDRDRERL